MKLNGLQKQQFHSALIDAFSKSELERLVNFYLDESLDNFTGKGSISDIVFELIRWAERKGRVEDLVNAALAENSTNQLLKDFSQQLNAFNQSDSSTPPVTSSNTSTPNPTISSTPRISYTEAPATEPSPRPPAQTSSNLSKDDITRLRKILTDYISSQNTSPQNVLNFLLSSAGLPPEWPQEVKGTWTGSIPIDVQNLLQWIKGKKGPNPADKRFTTLGSILSVLLPYVGFQERIILVAIIVRYGLYLDRQSLSELIANYQIPLPTRPTASAVSIGPEIIWEGPDEVTELQAHKKQQSDWLDVGELIRAIQKSVSVCRIEYSNISNKGTGFLVGRNLLLTNYHVLQPVEDADINAFAQQAIFRFGCFSKDEDNVMEGQTFQSIGPNAILSSSPSDELDYVLLQIEDRIQTVEGIGSLSWNFNQMPTEHMDLNILQHPEGGAMKLALSTNGVDKIVHKRGLIQYSTLTSGGSSGSPCFDKNWNLVAIHHAEHSRSFGGTVREGVLFSSIYDHIQKFLN